MGEKVRDVRLLGCAEGSFDSGDGEIFSGIYPFYSSTFFSSVYLLRGTTKVNSQVTPDWTFARQKQRVYDIVLNLGCMSVSLSWKNLILIWCCPVGFYSFSKYNSNFCCSFPIFSHLLNESLTLQIWEKVLLLVIYCS